MYYEENFNYFFLLLLLTSCTNVTSDGTTAQDTTNVTPVQVINIFINGNTEYKIIRSATASENCISAVLKLNNNFLSKFGSNCNDLSDWDNSAGRDGIVENSEYEILIGYTNRKESRDAYAQIENKEDSYIIKAVNNKLVIIGNTDYVTNMAIDAFILRYINSAEGKNLTMKYDDIIISQVSIQKNPVYKDADFRIMTFNVLGVNGIRDRSEGIIDEIYYYMPDILCAQEANAETHRLVLDKLNDYYSLAKSKLSENIKVNYTPILYKTKRYTVVESGVEWLRSRYTLTNTKSLSWAVFDDKETNKRFAVINIHGAIWSTGYTLPDGKTHEEMITLANEWRIDNVKQTLEKSKVLAEKYGETPCLFTGDYNCTSDSDAYKTAIASNLSDAEKSAGVNRCDTYKSTHTIGSMPSSGKTIDHIFGTSNVNFHVHNLATSASDLNTSDHCAVYADVSFK